MSSADTLLRAGDIDQTRAALVEAVKRDPQDQRVRMFLFQLLAVCGEWDKATVQLRMLAQISPEAQMLATVYHQAIEAEKVRAAAFAGAAPFHGMTSDFPWLGDLLAGLQAFAKGDAAEGEARREAAFAAAPDTPGEADGRAFDWIADADGRFGPTLETIVYGRWGLVPFEAIATVEFEGAKDLRDVVWAPAQIHFKSGQSVAALLPARYPGTEQASTPALRLARETTWRDGPAGQEGLGQKLLTLSDGEDLSLLSIGRLTFQ